MVVLSRHSSYISVVYMVRGKNKSFHMLLAVLMSQVSTFEILFCLRFELYCESVTGI